MRFRLFPKMRKQLLNIARSCAIVLNSVHTNVEVGEVDVQALRFHND